MLIYPKKIKNVLILFLLFQLLIVGLPLPTFAYPVYQANSDLVVTAPYDTAVSGAGNWSCASGCSTPSYREFITIGQKYRLRQAGTISQIKIYTASVTSLTGFYIKIWRKNGSTYDLVGTSNNIVSSLVAGNYATITLSSPITDVQEGDYYGYRIEASDSTNHFFARTSITGVTSYYINGVTPSATSYAWESVPPNLSLVGAVLPIELYMTAPQVAFIGDSIIAGHPAHYSFLETTATTNINSTIEKQFGNLTGYTYQNMGIGSQTTAGISSRFTADIINLKPKVVVIEGGVNDIAGAVAKSTFIANWTSMLDAAQASSYVTTIIVLKILPWTNGTNAQMQTRDDWNTSLATLAAGYSKAIVVDASSYVGQFRAGGDADNLWDIQTAYNQDGVHFNQAGHTQIAQAIVDHLPLTISSVSPADGATLIAVDSNLAITFDRAAYSQAGAQNDIIIKKASNNSVVETIDAQSAQVSGSGTNTITVNPSVVLDVATNYYIQIGADAFDDTTGNSFAGISDTTTWNFTTIDTDNPTIYTLSPTDNSIDVAINSNLVITFSEPVDVKTGNIVIKKTSDNSTFETIAVTSSNVTGSGTDTITINPTGAFNQSTDYYIQIDATAFDDATGNSFAGISDATTWNFTTTIFAYRKQITINNANIDATLTDFPLLVHLSTDSDIGLVTRSDGHDILFTTSDGQLLPYERESWSGGGGSAATADFWVKTTLNADNNVATNDTIYIYYGKADATDGSHVPDGTSNDVWSSNFAGVWHLDEVVTDEGTSGVHVDSVYNGNNGTQQGNVNISGSISNAQQFDGNDTVTINKTYTSSDISVSWWSKSAVLSPSAQGVFDVNRGSDRLFAYQWDLNTNGAYVMYKDSSTATLYKRGLDAGITQTDWHYYTAVWSETAKTFVVYLNGVAQSLVNTGVPTVPSTSTTRLGIAALNGAVSVDEFRISSVAESAAWIKFEYHNQADSGNNITFLEQTRINTAPSVTFDSDFSTWNSGNTTVNFNLIDNQNDTLNISQTESSGIEYSTDGTTWSDATKGTGGDNLTNLTSSASPGTDHSFIWDTATDLLTTEDSTVYLRIRPNDGTTSAADWVTSNAFGIDNVAPSSVGVPTFGTITTSSIQITKPATVTEAGSGLYQWQARRNSATELGYIATSTNTVTDSDLSPNTQYAYDVKFKDNSNNISSYGTPASKYTLADAPTNLSASSNSNSVTLSVDSLPNATSGSSGYYFSRSGGGNSGWIQTNSWTDTGLSCGHSYDYSVIYRNGEGTETSSISTTKSTNGCGGGGMPAGWSNLPITPIGGFKIFVNSGASTTTNRIVNLNFNAGADVKKMAISLTGDFNDASQENYSPTKRIDLCSKLGGLIKNPICPDGTYKVYVKFYTYYGQSSGIASSTIVLKSGSTTTENLQQNQPIFLKLFTKQLKPNQTDSDIKQLQIFLNSDPNTQVAKSGAGSPGKETNFFGLLTKKAVIKFQEKYAKEVLAPWGLKKGTGVVGKTTLIKINELIGK